MVQNQKNMHKGIQDTMRQAWPDFLASGIPFSVDVENMGEYRAPVDQFARSKPANAAYQSLWQEVQNRL